MLTRRRFIAMSAALTLSGAGPARAGGGLHLARTQALGAVVSLRLSHPDAPAIAARAFAEIARLEDVFSLYRPGSALMRLNATGRLEAPPFALLDCLTLAGAVNRASGGRFDPTVQPLWAAHAQAAVEGRLPDAAALQAAVALTGWGRLRMDAAAITLEPGMGLTLNGIAQGYVADRVAGLLADEGLDNILIDTGELRALGGDPRRGGGDWPVTLMAGGTTGGTVGLRGRALATSAPRGTCFDAAGRVGHILDPRSGHPAPAIWRAITLSAPTAALADAASTAACLMPDAAAVTAFCRRLPGLEVVSLTPA